MTCVKSNTPSFRSRITNAGFWSFGVHIFSQVIRLGSNLIMTRLLAPEMFGIIAIANVLMVGLALFSDIGLNQNIVQSKRGDDSAFLNTVWSVQIIRGLCMWFLALSVSGGFYLGVEFGWLAGDTVYSDPALPIVMAAIAFAAVISGFNSTRLATSMRNFAQKPLALLEIYSQLVGLVTMIVWASIDRSIWALVAGNLAGSSAKMVLSHLLLPGLPNRWHWNPDVFEEVLQFGKWIFLSSIIGFLLNNGDRLLLGGLVSSKLLGVYSISFLLVNALQIAVERLRSAVVFPALCEVVRERNHKFKEVYYKFRFCLDFGLLFMAGFLVVTGSLIVDILYDERYAQSGPIFQALALILVAQRYALADQCYLAMGKPKLMTVIIAVRLFSLYVLLPAGFYLYGMSGAVGGVVVANFICIPVMLYVKMKQNILDVKKEIVILPVFLLGVGFGNLICRFAA